MIRFLIPIILVVLAVVLARRYIQAAPSDKQKSRKIDVLLIAALVVLVILALLHRMHWLGVTVPAVIMAGRKLMGFISDFLAQRKKLNDSAEPATAAPSSSTPPASTNMTEDEALKILGLHTPYNKEEVIEAHRKLMQKLHPDRGGNDYLAAKINDAKELLLKKL